MNSGPVVVNYSQLTSHFGEGVESVADGMLGEELDDLERASVVATIQRAVSELRNAEVSSEVMSAPDDPVAAIFQSVIAENAADLGTLSAPVAGGAREVRFDQWDPAWAKTLVGLIKQRLNLGKFDFLPAPSTAVQLPDTCRVAVLGDWGSNAYGAPRVADSIVRDGDFAATVHLGDVYYSGSAAEVEGRFLADWPFVPGAFNRACNSNHEMFSGGKPYAKLTLPRFHQSSSLWWLENEYWVLLGLDTAYDDAQVGPLQAGWVDGVCAQATANHKRVILFSHHQPWKTSDGTELSRLVDPLRNTLDAGQVFGWYWGHEHLCALFEPHSDWGTRGACLGHGGFPYERLDVSAWPLLDRVADEGTWHQLPKRNRAPAGVLLDGPNRWIESHESAFGPNGYAVLELAGEHLLERVYTPSGVQVHERRLA